MSEERVAGLLHTVNNVVPIARCFGMVLSDTEEGQTVTDLVRKPKLDDSII